MKITNRLKIALKSVLNVKLGEIATDKGTLVFDGDEIAVGVEVFVNDENAEDGVKPAEDGEYAVEGGKVIVVADGVVTEIREPEAEPEVEIEAEVEPQPADEPEVEAPNADERIAALEERIAAIAEGINDIVNAIAALEERITEVEGKLAKVEEPQAEPVEEKPAEEIKMSKLAWLKQK